MDAGTPSEETRQKMDADLARARWVADLAITLTARWTDAQRLMRLNEAYDVAHAQGMADCIERVLSKP